MLKDIEQSFCRTRLIAPVRKPRRRLYEGRKTMLTGKISKIAVRAIPAAAFVLLLCAAAFWPAGCLNGSFDFAGAGHLSGKEDFPGEPQAGSEFSTATGDNPDFYLTYEVAGDRLYPCESPAAGSSGRWQDPAVHAEIWELVLTVIPEEYRPMIAYFEIFTDGRDGTLGAIECVDNNEEFILSIDVADFLRKDNVLLRDELVETILHELGHIITLNAGQVYSGHLKQGNNPQTYQADFGDTREDSYLNIFYHRFWPEIHNEWFAISLIDHEQARETALYHFYETHQDRFVSDYAALDPEEDIAESFAVFILETKPYGHTEAAQKVLFFYEFPELVELRHRIRAALE